jgi:hypothetical protein
MSGIQLAAGGSKGMRPSIDANNLIMVDAASDAIGEQQARRYIHHEDNLSPKRFLLLYGVCTVHSRLTQGSRRFYRRGYPPTLQQHAPASAG